MARPDAVIFDMDGVLVDSEILVGRIEVDMLAELGAAVTLDEIVQNFMGRSDATMTKMLRRDWGIELPEGFDAERTRRVAARFDEALEAIRGIDGVLLDLIAAGIPRCVASSSAPARIAHSLTLTGLRDHFDGHLYSAAMVANGKPAPDLFLHAAARLGVASAACVVVEDSPPGVQAGVAAGMDVIGFTAAAHCTADHAERLEAAGAQRTATTAEELSALLIAGLAG